MPFIIEDIQAVKRRSQSMEKVKEYADYDYDENEVKITEGFQAEILPG